MKTRSIFFSLLILIFASQCASVDSSNLESAKFALDQSNYTEAIRLATNYLADNPGDIEASRTLASAYFGRSGIDFLDIAEALLDLDTATVSNFQAIANVLPTTATMSDVRSAITTLEALSGIDAATISNEALADSVFDLALMQGVEHFAIGVYQSNYSTDNSTLDVTQIAATGKDNVQADLVAFDNRFIGSGVDSTETFLQEIRQTFCILEPISAGEGFTLAEYQALVGCQLSDNPDTFDTAALTGDIANCAALLPDSQTTAVQNCYSQNTSL